MNHKFICCYIANAANRGATKYQAQQMKSVITAIFNGKPSIRSHSLRQYQLKQNNDKQCNQLKILNAKIQWIDQ